MCTTADLRGSKRKAPSKEIKGMNKYERSKRMSKGNKQEFGGSDMKQRGWIVQKETALLVQTWVNRVVELPPLIEPDLS